jgi:hypothetical protein
MKRAFRFGLAFVLLVGVLSQAPASSAAVASGAVVVTVVHSAQTITFSVRLTLFPACPDPNCVVTPSAARAIQSAIESVWNQGFKYKCYTIHVQVDIELSPDPLTDAADRVGVQIDQSPVPIRSQVLTQGSRHDPLSTDPSSIIHATNVDSQFGRTLWAYPPRSTGTYAHEFGHILGLDDTYDDNGDIAGSPHDLMNGGMFDRPPQLADATIERLVKRNGIRDSELQCAWKGTYDSGGVFASGFKCDTPVGTWVLHEEIAAAVSQQFTLKIEIRRDLSGTWHHTYTVGAGPVSVTGQDSGTASFDYGPPPTMTVSQFGVIELTPLADCPR